MIWLGERRGHATDWSTQLWVRATGRKASLAEHPWLGGPVGDTRRIGADCFRQLAAREGLSLQDGPAPQGIVPDFDCLEGPDFRCSAVSRGVRHFYEHTAGYELDAWAEWCGAFRPFGWLLAVLFSRRLQQLNVPLSGLDTSRGLSNAVWHLVEPSTREVRHVVWVRQLVGSGTTVYAGSYGPCRVPGWPGTCLKVAFPLPNGNALVIRDDTTLSVRYVPTMRETIRVYESGPQEARADHTLTIWGVVFLRLHYRLRRQQHA